MLSDNERKQAIPSRRGRPLGTVGHHWSDSQKLEAVTTYLSLGNLALASRVLKIPEMTLRTWKKKDWWMEIESELKVAENLQLSARLRRIIESTLTTTEDRLQNGDWIYDNKTGSMVRKPVNMRDAHKVTMDMMERREVLDNQKPVHTSIEQIDDKLKKLAEKFEQIATGRITPVLEVTDVIIGTEVVEADVSADGYGA